VAARAKQTKLKAAYFTSNAAVTSLLASFRAII